MTLYELAEIDAVQRDGQYRFRCEATFGQDPAESCPFFIEFFAPELAVIHLNPYTKACEYSPHTAFDRRVEQAFEVERSDTDGAVHLETDALEVTIDTEAAAISMHRPNGEQLFDTNPDTVDTKGNLGVRTFGFTTEPVNRHPLRVQQCHMALSLSPNENIYGGGEQKGDPNKRGDVTTAWVTQAGGSASRSTYKSTPFFLSDNDYGCYVDTTARTTFDFGQSVSGATEITVEDDVLSLIVFAGESMKDVLRQYTARTGRPPRLPKWTYGLWTSRNTYEDEAEALEIVQSYRERSIPCDVLHLDPSWLSWESEEPLQWDLDRFPDPAGFIDTLHERGFKLSLWEFPYLDLGSEAFKRARERDYLVKDGAGRPYIYWDRGTYPSESGILDFTNPEVCEWWTELHVELLEMGVDVFKADFGEYLPVDTVLSDGTTGKISRNRYPALYQDTIRDAFDRVGVSPVLWSRAGWAGGQTYAIHWGGDAHATYDGFRTSVEMGLSISLSGYQFWSCDSGGYKPTPSPHLYTRWTQWSLLGNSHTRLHGKTPREPWAYGEEAEEAVTGIIEERYRLIPYLYSYGNHAADTGIPLLRPMILEHENDPAVRHRATQHYLGPSLLVAPILSEDDDVEVYLPAGTWYDYWTDEIHEGPTVIEHEDYPLDRLPVYVPNGSVIPKQDVLDHLDDPGYHGLTLHVYGESDASGILTHPDTGSQEDIEISLGDDQVTISSTAPPVAFDLEAIVIHGTPTEHLELPAEKRDRKELTLRR